MRGTWKYGDVLKTRSYPGWKVMFIRRAKAKEAAGQGHMFWGITVRGDRRLGKNVGNRSMFPEGLWSRDDD
jgi:hypothetical protein